MPPLIETLIGVSMNSLKRAFSATVVTAVVAVLSACGSGSSVTTQAPTDFQTTVSTAGVIVLDVRTPEEFMSGHLQNAVNLDVDGADFDSQISTLDKNATYAVYCHSGRRSGIATGKMASAGFTHVYNLDGGIAAWMGAGLPVVQ
jgi:rhodanese-related sulfurtransferase